MRRIKLLLATLLVSQLSFAGGIVTNTNQSAAYIRMLARDASVDVDAVFYNPAALTKLDDGFYIQLNNQTVLQKRNINNTYVSKDFEGKVFVPALPTVFAAYKTGDFAFSAGFTVIGGGGSANFEQGLPDFEYPFKAITQLISASGISTSQYGADIAFNGTSIYYGAQAGVSYKINDVISVFAGARYVIVHNGYEGHIKDVQMNPTYPVLGYDGQQMVSAPSFFNDLEAAATSTGDLANMMMARALGEATQDRIVDVEQKGTGITPIVGVNLSMMDNKLNIGLKYEFATEIDIENYSYQDDTKGMPGMSLGMFPDRAMLAADMPAFLSAGVGYQMTDKFYATVGLHYYFDGGVDYGKNGWIIDAATNLPKVDADGVPTYNRGDNTGWTDGNSYELALGLEYALSETFALSGGYLMTATHVTKEYQSGLSYSLNSNTFAAGANLKLSPKFDLDLGFLYTMYAPYEKEVSYTLSGNPIPGNYLETYEKSNMVFSFGLTYKFGSN